MRKALAILLHGELKNDYRVIKTIRTLSVEFDVSVFFVGNETPVGLNDTVQLHSVQYPTSFKQKLLRHSYFTKEYAFLEQAVLESGTTFDLIWANDLPTLLPASKLANRFGAKLIYDSHEIYNETLNQFFPANAGFPKGNIARFLLRTMRRHGKKEEARLVKLVDLLISVNRSIVEYFEQCCDVKRSLTMMNFPDVTKTTSEIVDFRSKFSWNKNDRVFLYQGVLNQGRGLSLLVETFSQTPEHFRLIVIGNGPLKGDLVQLSELLNIGDKVKFIPAVPLEELPSYTQGADIGINLLEPINLSKKLASPNKLFEYIHAKIPVICSDTPENIKVIERFPIGLLVENNSQSIIDGMKKLDAEIAAVDTQIFEDASKTFTWSEQAKDLMQVLNEIAQ